jgi:hypothetical protein
MTFFLTLLKIIGVILLAIILLVLFLLLCVLFAPVTYRAVGNIHEKQVDGHVRVSWLFRLVNFHIWYEKSDMKMYLRLFGFRKWLAETEGTDEPDDFDISDKYSESGSPHEQQTTEHPDMETDSADNAVRDMSREKESHADKVVKDTSQEEQDSADKVVQNTTQEEENSAEDESDSPKKDTIVQKIRRKWKSLTEKIKNIKKRIRKISQMLEDPVNKDAISHLKRAVISLLKSIMPSKLKLKLSYSTGSPDTTAQVFGILAMFPIGYTNRWMIQPDFEADLAYADGDLDISGHFLVVRLLLVILGVVLDKKCRRLYRRLKRI